MANRILTAALTAVGMVAVCAAVAWGASPTPGGRAVGDNPPPGAVLTPGVTPAVVAAEVTYGCTGQAPGGVDITYGANGRSDTASALPFSHSEPVDDAALFYVTDARLHGGGSVLCTTTITWNGSDGGHTVTKMAQATGGGTADAGVCFGVNGWEPCSGP